MLLTAFIGIMAQSGYGTGGGFNPDSPDIPGGNGFYNDDTMVLDAFRSHDVEQAIYDLYVQYGQPRDLETEEFYEMVKHLVVCGLFDSDWFSAGDLLYYFPRLESLDLSRTYGWNILYMDYSEAPKLNLLLLPDCVQSVESAFFDCPKLKDIYCYAEVPPEVNLYYEDKLFEYPDQVTLHVPAQSAPLYRADKYWGDAYVVALDQDVMTIEVRMPADVDLADYRNMNLILTDEASHEATRYIVSDRTKYYFPGLLSADQTTWRIEMMNRLGSMVASVSGVKASKGTTVITLPTLKPVYQATARVLSDDNSAYDMSNKSQVTWYSADGSTRLTSGLTVAGLVAGDHVVATATLDDFYSDTYTDPQSVLLTIIGDGDEAILRAHEMKHVILTATVVDADTRQPLSGITMSAMQTFASGKSNTFNTSTIFSGYARTLVREGDLKVSFYSKDYMRTEVNTSTAYAKPLYPDQSISDAIELGTIALKPISGMRVNLDLKLQYSTVEGYQSVGSSLFNRQNDLLFTIHNDSWDEDIVDFKVQYPIIVLTDGVEDGNDITVTVSSHSNCFDPVSFSATIEDCQAKIEGVVLERGILRTSFGTTKNSSVVAMLYDDNGDLYGVYHHERALLEVSSIDKGNYTLITMGDDPVLARLSTLDAFSHAGLQADRDYVRNSITIKPGFITVVENESIPLLEAEELKMVSHNTTFSVLKDVVPRGDYVTFRSRIKVLDRYASDWKYSGYQFVITPPNGCKYMEGSLMVNGQPATFSKDGTTLRVDISSAVEQGEVADVRFCLTTSSIGTFTPMAMLGYRYNWDSEYLSPIGTTSFEVTPLRYNLHQVSPDGYLVVSGEGPRNAIVRVYDDDAFITQTTINGTVWALRTELPDNYNLSFHPIRFECETTDGQVFKSAITTVMVDHDYVGPTKVTMLYPNGYSNKTEVCTFNFNIADIEEETYDYYDAADFTFITEFTKNDTTLVKDVQLVVEMSNGRKVTVYPTFDENRGCWVGVYNNQNAYYNMPVSVTVGFNCSQSVATADRRQISSQQTDVKDLTERIGQLSAIARALNEDNIEEQLAAFESLLGKKLFKDLSEEDTDWAEWFHGLSAEDAEWEADALIEEIQEMLDTLVTFNDNVMQSFAADLTDFTLADGTRIIIGDCSGLDENQLLAQGYEKVSASDSTFIYIFEDDSHCVVADLGTNQTIEMIYSRSIDRRRKAGVIETCLEIRNTLNDLIERITGTLNEFLVKAALNIDKLTLQSEALDRAAIRLEVALENPNIGAAKRFVLRARYLSTLASKLTTEECLMVARHVPGLLRKVLPVYSYYSLFKDFTEKADKLAEVYLGLPRPCPEDEAGVAECESRCKRLSVLMLAFTTGKLVLQVTSDIAMATGVVAAPETGGLALVATVAGYVAKTLGLFAADWAYNKTCAYETGDIGATAAGLKCNEEEEDKPYDPGELRRKRPPLIEVDYTGKKKRPIIDPAGFVCEAVESNRLEGVTATCYYKAMVEDMYGDKSEQAVVWDAAAYGQMNPLTTDAEGMYQWWVPEGKWQVVYEKDGYETARSAWLPVPPPQLDVNIGMVRLEQPVLADAVAYEKGIDLDFSLYMKKATVSDLTVSVSQGDSPVEGSLQAIDAEKAFDDANTMLARRFRFVPKHTLTIGTKVQIRVSSLARSYAGIAMGADDVRTLTVGREITSVMTEDGDTVIVPYGGTHQVVVVAQSAQAAAHQVLDINVVTPMVAAVDTSTVVLDDEGKAYVTLRGLLPGMTFLHFSVGAGNHVDGQAVVRVVGEDGTAPMAPQASLISGIYVEPGTAVQLTAQPGCTVWYTLDGSCPCDEQHRILYTSPITINGNVTLRAMAISPSGVESEVVTYVWFVSSINMVGVDSPSSDAIYDLYGRRLSGGLPSRRGLYIKGQRKLLVR